MYPILFDDYVFFVRLGILRRVAQDERLITIYSTPVSKKDLAVVLNGCMG